MNILVNYEHGGTALKQVAVEEFCEFVLREENVPDNSEVSISFVNDQKIHKLNKQYRNIDSKTDVLSFECDYPDENNKREEAIILGDIIIAPDVARNQAEEYGNSFLQEIELLLCHGLLHLLGYDHIEDEDAEIMEAREKEILELWHKKASSQIVHHSNKEKPLSLLKVFGFALSGIKYTFVTQRNLKIHSIVALFAILLSLILKISLTEFACIMICIFSVMASECINTSIESLVDLVSPNWHMLAKHTKDCAAGAVLLFSIMSIIVGLFIFIPKILSLIS